MGFFGDITKLAYNSLKEKTENAQNYYLEWSGSDIKFLIRQSKKDDLAKRVAALKLLREEHRLNNDDIAYYQKKY